MATGVVEEESSRLDSHCILHLPPFFGPRSASYYLSSASSGERSSNVFGGAREEREREESRVIRCRNGKESEKRLCCRAEWRSSLSVSTSPPIRTVH